MQTLYNILSYIAIPWIVLRLLIKSIRLPAYRQRIFERFGFVPTIHGCVWFHAVSVGESIAAAPLIERCLQAYPDIPVVVTNMTPTGSARVRAMFAKRVHNVYVPYDIPGAVKRFLARVQPKILVLIETELWPNLLHYCHDQQVPVLLANARLSQKSADNYRQFSDMTNRMLDCISHVAVQASADRDRFVSLGVSVENTSIVGSVKYDISVPASVAARASQLRDQLGADRPVFIAASTHPGEEEQVLAAFDVILQQRTDAVLILVPRHPNRCQDIQAVIEQKPLSVNRRSANIDFSKESQVVLVDTMGEMLLFMAMADVVFVGGSLVNVGGHNTLEAAVLSKPVLQGPIHHNFVEITRLLTKAGALLEVADVDELAAQVLRLFSEPLECQRMGQAGQAVIEANRGSVDKQFALMQRIMKNSTVLK